MFKNFKSKKVQRRNFARGGGPLPSLSRKATFSHPPQVHPQVAQTIRLRFTSNAAFGANISWKNLLDTINVAASAVTVYQLYDQVKILSIEIWSNPAIGAAPASIFLTYYGAVAGQAGDAKEHSDTSIGIEPAHLRAAPDQKSQASQWQAQSANVAFGLTVPTASVIDVSLSFRMVNNIAPVLTTNAPVGATPGGVYFRGLDGVAVAGTQLPAVAPLTN